jgi:hypothetical protein
VVPLTDNAIADHYMRDGHGIAIGYKLYNEKGISTQVGKNVEILSDSLPGEQKRAGNVKVTKSSVGLTSMTIPVIETMEILQNYSKIEDLKQTSTNFDYDRQELVFQCFEPTELNWYMLLDRESTIETANSLFRIGTIFFAVD